MIVPNKPVTADKGISADVKLLDNISTSIIKIPPNVHVNGIVLVVFFPTINLTICGMTNPTQEIVPEKATDVAVNNVAIKIITVL